MIDMNGPCICPGDPDHTPHPDPCGAPNSGTGHGPWGDGGMHITPWQTVEETP